jgi:succinyl-CoA synthetase beta subunit
MVKLVTKEMRGILAEARSAGWVLEPEAKRFLSLAGIRVPRYAWAKTLEEAREAANSIGFPVVAKVVSPKVLHKSDVGGVEACIENEILLGEAFGRFAAMEGFSGMLVEERVSGVELIIGGKVDFQFGPVVIVGIGGVGVGLYQDTSIRMAPVRPANVEHMLHTLKAFELIEGYRGSEPVNTAELTRTIIAFSDLMLELGDSIESIDMNPVMCSADACITADARIMLPKA